MSPRRRAQMGAVSSPPVFSYAAPLLVFFPTLVSFLDQWTPSVAECHSVTVNLTCDIYHRSWSTRYIASHVLYALFENRQKRRLSTVQASGYSTGSFNHGSYWLFFSSKNYWWSLLLRWQQNCKRNKAAAKLENIGAEANDVVVRLFAAATRSGAHRYCFRPM